jgi:antitoxin component of MazEF toxin-antitoxin module
MKNRIRKWGKSRVARILKSLASDAGLDEGMLVDVALVQGKLALTPVPEPLSLERFLAGITAGNRHPELDFDGPAGGEPS